MKPFVCTKVPLWAAVLGMMVATEIAAEEALRSIARGLNRVRIDGRDVTFVSNKTVLDSSWSRATLLKGGLTSQVSSGANGISNKIGVEIVCETCYIKGIASASLTINGNFSDIITNYTAEIKDVVTNVTERALGQVEAVMKNTTKGFLPGDIFGQDDDDNDFQFPTIDVGFDLDLAPLPSVSVRFEFDEDFELYMLFSTKLATGATYTLNLFSSASPLGIAVGGDITAGVACVLDLILDVQTAVDITSGFHLKLDKGVGMELNMFSQSVSRIDIPGGQFEFLPVTLLSEGAVLTGVLRFSLKAGLELSTGGMTNPLHAILSGVLPIGAGVVAQVFANFAEFVTNVSVPSNASDRGKPVCDIKVVEVYQFALGAAAGATLAIGDHTWGPMPNTSIPIFYTTLTSACITRITSPSVTTTMVASPTTTSGGGFLHGIFGRGVTALPWVRRDTTASLTSATLTSTATFTAQTCLSSGVINCPASLQTTTTYTSVLTYITAVSSGVTPNFPPTSATTVASMISFGDGARKLISSAGTPISYIPPPPPAPPPTPTPTTLDTNSSSHIGGVLKPGEVAADLKGWLEEDTNGVSNRTVLGLVLGLGIPGTALMIFGLVKYFKPRRYLSIRPLSRINSDLSGEVPPADLKRAMLARKPFAMLLERFMR